MVELQQMTDGKRPAVVFYDPSRCEACVVVLLADEAPPAELFQAGLRQALAEGRGDYRGPQYP